VAAPTLQAEGALTVVTTGALAPAIPTHQADDILVVAWGFWGPNSTSLPDAAVPTGWTQLSQFDAPALDGKIGYFWMRAPSAGQTISIARPSGWDTGTDTAWGGRAYVIRGAITTGNPWDEADPTAVYSAANQPVDALTVLGTERLAIHFLVKQDDFVTAPTVSGWTAGTQVESVTGTDHSQGSFRKDNVSADTGADVSTVEAPAAGRYAFLGVSFKPPAITTVDKTHTTDTLLKATATKTHTTDSLLKATTDKTHTTDSFLKATVGKTHTTDSLLKATTTKTHSTDAFLSSGVDITYSTDSLLKATQTKTHTTDSLLKATAEKAQTTDSLFKATVEKTQTTDSFLKATVNKTQSTDSLLKATAEKAQTTDSLLKATTTKIHSTDSLQKATVEKAQTTDSLLKATVVKAHTTDSLLKAAVAKAHASDSLLKATVQASHSTDSRLVQTVDRTHSTDSLLETEVIATAGMPFVYNSANYEGYEWSFQAYIRAASGTVTAELYDDTRDDVVYNSSLSTSSATLVLLESGKIELVDGHQYTLRLRRGSLSAGRIRSACLIGTGRV